MEPNSKEYEFSIDEALALSDNDGNAYPSESFEKIAKADLKPENDPNCAHNLVHDEAEEPLGNCWPYKCTKCPLGFYLPQKP